MPFYSKESTGQDLLVDYFILFYTPGPCAEDVGLLWSYPWIESTLGEILNLTHFTYLRWSAMFPSSWGIVRVNFGKLPGLPFSRAPLCLRTWVEVRRVLPIYP